MGEGEGSDLKEERSQVRAQQEQPEDEEDVVEPLGNDVPDAQTEIARRDREPARLGREPRRYGKGVALRAAGEHEVAHVAPALVEHRQVDRGKDRRDLEGDGARTRRDGPTETRRESE